MAKQKVVLMNSLSGIVDHIHDAELHAWLVYWLAAGGAGERRCEDDVPGFDFVNDSAPANLIQRRIAYKIFS